MNSVLIESGGGAYKRPETDCARLVTLIETTLLRRGNGTDDPAVVTQYWTLDGVLLCEVDPSSFSSTNVEGMARREDAKIDQTAGSASPSPTCSPSSFMHTGRFPPQSLWHLGFEGLTGLSHRFDCSVLERLR